MALVHQVAVLFARYNHSKRQFRSIEHDSNPACLGYNDYPNTTCISINEVICHGIPKNKRLKNGDILNIDLVVEKDGYHGDTSKMFIAGEASKEAQRLVRVTQESLYLGIKEV